MHVIPPVPKLPRNTWVDKIRTAVLTLMYMNHRLYKHLYSSTFDVPDYEKENILYNNETLYLQYQQYLAVDFTNPDFKFHQSQLDVQILCNRRLRENIRDARKMYADISNPLYKRKKIITAKVFPNAAQLNLPKALPMTYLCDHLLSVYHYMYDPVIEDVMNYITGEKPSVTPGMQQPGRRQRGFTEEINTDGDCTFIDIRARRAYKPAEFEEMPKPVYLFDLPHPFRDVETSGIAKPVDLAEAFPLVETPELSKPIEIPKPSQLVETPEISKPTQIPKSSQLVETPEISKPIEIPKPPQLVETPEISKPIEIHKPSQLVETSEISKPIEIHKPPQLVETPELSKPIEIPKPSQLVETPEISKPTQIPKSSQLVETPEISKPIEIPKPPQLVETPEISKPIEIPKPPQLVETPEISKPIEIHKPSQLVEIPEFSKPIKIPIPVQLTEALTFSKPAQPPKPVQFEEPPKIPKRSNQTEKIKPNQTEKPKLICESDVVGQILLQGLDCSKIQLPSQRCSASTSSTVKNTNKDKVAEPVRTTDSKIASAISNPATARDINVYKTARETTVQDLRSSAKPTKTVSKVAWDVNKVLAPTIKPGEKRPRNVLSGSVVQKEQREAVDVNKRLTDILDDNIQEEMFAKRQRMAQWLQDCASKPAGSKRKASLMDKSRKDHAAKRQKMTEARPRSAASQPFKVTEKKSGINWVIRW